MLPPWEISWGNPSVHWVCMLCLLGNGRCVTLRVFGKVHRTSRPITTKQKWFHPERGSFLRKRQKTIMPDFLKEFCVTFCQHEKRACRQTVHWNCKCLQVGLTSCRCLFTLPLMKLVKQLNKWKTTCTRQTWQYCISAKNLSGLTTSLITFLRFNTADYTV